MQNRDTGPAAHPETGAAALSGDAAVATVVLDGNFELDNGIRVVGANGVAIENLLTEEVFVEVPRVVLHGGRDLVPHFLDASHTPLQPCKSLRLRCLGLC